MFVPKLELEIAWSYLASKSFRGLVSILSLLGIAIGVASLIVVTSVMDGFRNELFSSLIGIGGHVNIRVRHYTYDDFATLNASLSEIEHISTVVPALEMQSIVSNGNEVTGVLVKAMSLQDFSDDHFVMDKIVAGEVSGFQDGVIIGKRIADSLGVGVGDEITFLSASYSNTILGPIPRMKRIKIAAIFSFGMVEYDSALIYMPFDIASIFFRSGLNNVSIYLDDPGIAHDVSKKIMSKLPEMDISSWQDEKNPYFRAIKIEKSIMSIILMMIVLVAAFNIISSLFMLVDEKKQSIAILRTMGMTKASIIRIFISCGSIIGVAGTALGAFLGVLLSLNINGVRSMIEKLTEEPLFDPSVYFVDKIPVSLSFTGVTVISLSAMLIAFLATIPPAYKASIQNPGSVLR
ncbi:liporeleasing system, transmembrane, LolC/E family protein [Neorickettsia helminthoeca str. Oregon]|uniref:Liporeleasing system, transmembrane, LolC/E family protein n=1 Tax=Neorickettsia helminthoeca str. Oregon TaxID=1286528 RepID=X5H3G7_9RICK|nr:lipoprotein-releasing ABC transporter permease subunit [Neorickettsia helminthoeca]AHX11096.1 liporeleasing system, transmembrane, LolC/E family protein [Neorickettsia helminthoeca str. Oregon]